MSSLQAHEQRINRLINQFVEKAFQSKLNFSENKSSKSGFKNGVFRKKIKITEEAKRDTTSTAGEKKKEESNEVETPIFFALFIERRIIIQKIVVLGAIDVESQITHNGIVDINKNKIQTDPISQKKKNEEVQVFYSCLKVEKESQDV